MKDQFTKVKKWLRKKTQTTEKLPERNGWLLDRTAPELTVSTEHCQGVAVSGSRKPEVLFYTQEGFPKTSESSYWVLNVLC